MVFLQDAAEQKRAGGSPECQSFLESGLRGAGTETDFATVVSKDMDAETIIRKVVVDPDTVDAPVHQGTGVREGGAVRQCGPEAGEVNLVASESLGTQRSSGLLAGGAEFPTVPVVLGGDYPAGAAAYRIHYPQHCP